MIRFVFVIVFVSVVSVVAFHFKTQRLIVETKTQTHAAAKQNQRYSHVVFTTNGRKTDEIYRVIYENAIASVVSFDRVVVLVFGQDDESIERNEFGYPVLRSMYAAAFAKYPDAETYTYFNGDLIFNSSFLATLDAVAFHARANKIKRRFLGVGYRFNVRWRVSDRFDNETFSRFISKANRFQDDAQDFFIVSPGMWSTWPPLVVGRIAYDNWLVQNVTRDANASAIDVTKTNPAIHQTAYTDFAGHEGFGRNKHYNFEVISKHDPTWISDLGKMSSCVLETRWARGEVVVTSRRDTL